MKNRINEILESKRKYFTDIADYIWANPELACREFKSAKALKDAMVECGFEVTENLAGIETAFKGQFGSGHPVIGFLGEFDALAGLSQESLNPEKCPIVPGAPGHGCGHNAIGTGCLAAAVAMKELMEEYKLPGTVIVYGCPAEEQGCGKSFMTREGVFSELDVALAPHPSDSNNIMGVSMLANIQAEFTFYGQAAHAAANPDKGRSALDAADLMIVGVQFLREHIVQEARIHHAYIDAGGTSPNVVQAQAKLLFYIRAPKGYQVKEIFARVQDVAKGAAIMTGTTWKCEIKSGMTDLLNNDVLGNVSAEAWAEIGETQFSEKAYEVAKLLAPAVGNPEAKDVLDKSVPKYVRIPVAMPGSTDVGDVSYVVPTVMYMYAAETKGTPGHSWQLVAQSGTELMHDGMMHNAKVMALVGMKLMQNPELVKQAKEEFDSYGVEYDCLIPADVQPEAQAE